MLTVVTIVLDDLHFADEPSLSLLRSLAAAKVKMLLIVTVKPDFLPAAHEIFGQGSRATYIPISALPLDAVNSLVSEVLHDSVAHVAPLAQTLYQYVSDPLIVASLPS
jgi:predicted ATPase